MTPWETVARPQSRTDRMGCPVHGGKGDWRMNTPLQEPERTFPESDFTLVGGSDHSWVFHEITDCNTDRGVVDDDVLGATTRLDLAPEDGRIRDPLFSQGIHGGDAAWRCRIGSDR